MTLRLTLAAALFLSASAFAAEPGKPPITAQVSASGGQLDPAQKKLKFESADLQFEVDPDREVLNGVASLVFTTRDRTDKVVIDLDNNYTVTAVTV